MTLLQIMMCQMHYSLGDILQSPVQSVQAALEDVLFSTFFHIVREKCQTGTPLLYLLLLLAYLFCKHF